MKKTNPFDRKIYITLFVVIVLIFIIIPSKEDNEIQNGSENIGEISGSVDNSKLLNMQLYNVIDAQMGIPAFRVLAQDGYTLSGGLTWDNNLANLVTADVSITSPDNSIGFFIHPAPMYISGTIENQWQYGQSYLGMTVVPMPESPTEFIRQIIFPERRPAAENVQLVKEIELSDWANSIALVNDPSGRNVNGYGVCARFAYRENGIDWEEDFYCVILVAPTQVGTRWLADRNLSIRARKGKLDEIETIAKTFVNSFRVEKDWYARFSKVQSEWIASQQRGIYNAGVLSRIISNSNDQFNQSLMESWNTRQQAEDRAAREFSEYIRDSENYSDPINERNVELPGGYDQVWTNVNGEYILTSEAGFDPNINSNVEWEEIQRLR